MSSTNVYTGISSALNISADNQVRVGGGRLVTVSVITAGSAPGAVHDSDAIANVSAATQIGVIPNAVGIYTFDWPVFKGITYKAGAGQVVSFKFT